MKSMLGRSNCRGSQATGPSSAKYDALTELYSEWISSAIGTGIHHSWESMVMRIGLRYWE